MTQELSSPYQGPADPMERFEKLMRSWAIFWGENEDASNDLRIAFQLGREQGHLEASAADYENPIP